MHAQRLAYAILFVVASSLIASGFAQGSLAFIQGDWNNQGGDNIKITEDQLGGWDAWLGDVGQGNISHSTYKGSNIKVEAKNIRCWFRATVLSGGNAMNWKLVASDGDCSSIEGYFHRQ